MAESGEYFNENVHCVVQMGEYISGFQSESQIFQPPTALLSQVLFAYFDNSDQCL